MQPSSAPDQSQGDLAIQVETLTAQLNRLQQQCDQMAGLMQLKDWVTSLWMKRTREWEAQATELERERDHLRQELDRSQKCKAFWRRTATERLVVSQQWTELCQKQTEKIVGLKHEYAPKEVEVSTSAGMGANRVWARIHGPLSLKKGIAEPNFQSPTA